ncbi:MAG: IS1634 family transposase, partial [Candidatus Desulforudis sp.]|nr:IS1634 family transposase [Desulforudis sp.]
MYIRTTSRQNKNGTETRYVQLAHNKWNPKARRSEVQVIYNFGREEHVDRQGLERLARSISRYLGPEETLRFESSRDHGEEFRFETSKPLGGAWVLHELWKQLAVDQVLKKLLKERKFQSPVERAIFALVANRALSPMSKRAVEEWVAQDVYIPDLPDIPLHHLYRAMDFLLEAQEPLQYQVFCQVSHLFNLEVDLLYFDTTSTYFEIETEDDEGLRRKGHTKDSRPDLPQAVIGLAVTRDGIPVRCWVWPGNTADMSVVQEVKNDLVGWKLGRVITVLDRGMASDENLRYLQRAGGHYIAGERMRAGKEAVEKALSHPGRFKTVRDNLEVKEIVIGNGEARTRYVLVRNPEEVQRDQAKREEILEKLKLELARIGELDGAPHTKAVCSIIAHPTYGRYLKTDKRGQPRIDKDKIKAEERLDGKYLLRTSDDTLAPEDVALGYKQLLQVEDAFRTLKSTLELRPVYHRLEDRIRAHVLLCWLALLLIRVAENKTGQTWRTIRTHLERMHVGEFVFPSGRVHQRTE